jgi:hypothetical protein
LEDTAANDATRKQFRRMGDAWLALAETQDWLDAATPSVSRPQPQSADLIPTPTQGRSS